MASGDSYRVRAAELHVIADQEPNPVIKAELEALALAYLRLAGQADRNAQNDIVYETPARPSGVVQQQQQRQPRDPADGAGD